MFSYRIICIATAMAVAGCAVSPQQFSQRRNTMSDTEVCRAATTARQSGDNAFITMVNEEGARRSLTVEKCNALIAKSDKDAAIAAVALVGIAAVALATSRDSGSAPVSNSEYAWVRAYNKKRQLVWECREVKTGKQEELYHCQDLPKPGAD